VRGRTRITAGVLALCGVLVLATMAFARLDEGCEGVACDLRVATAPCEQLGERDLNPRNRPIAPRRRQPLLARRSDGHLPIGFNDAAYDAGQATLLEDVSLHRVVGSQLWRVPLSWPAVEPQPAAYDFSAPDTTYCAALSAGIQPVFHITAAPDWAADLTAPCIPEPGCLRPPLPAYLDELQTFAELVATRYPEAAAIEVWNEPNVSRFWDRPDPVRYTGVLRAVYTGIKNGNPGMPVLGGALANNGEDDPPRGLSLTTFLDRMYAAGAGRYMDGISLHPYPRLALGDPREAFSRSLSEVREVIASHEAPGARRLWITEVGTSGVQSPISAPLSLDQQTETMRGVYAALDAAPDVDAAVFHTLVDPNELVASPPGFGFVTEEEDGDFAPKPIYCELAALLAEPIDCDEPVPLPD
jgi:polysaccharide biosynthesis protein PslG